MILFIDNFDSFSYNLVDYFEQLGQEVIVKRNDLTLTELKSLRFDRVVISPGPSTPSLSGNLMQMIDYLYDKYPVLGVCLGHQALGQYFGSNVQKSQTPSHGKRVQITHFDHPLFNNIPNSFSVVKYNSLVIDNKSTEIEYIAFDLNDEIMAIAHKFLPIYGLQYHPESILTSHGFEILSNWLSLKR